MGDHQIALQRITNRVRAEALRGLRRFDRGKGYASTLALRRTEARRLSTTCRSITAARMRKA